MYTESTQKERNLNYVEKVSKRTVLKRREKGPNRLSTCRRLYCCRSNWTNCLYFFSIRATTFTGSALQCTYMENPYTDSVLRLSEEFPLESNYGPALLLECLPNHCAVPHSKLCFITLPQNADVPLNLRSISNPPPPSQRKDIYKEHQPARRPAWLAGGK